MPVHSLDEVATACRGLDGVDLVDARLPIQVQ